MKPATTVILVCALNALFACAQVGNSSGADGGATSADSGNGPDGGADGGFLPSRVFHVLWTAHVEGDSQGMTATDPACPAPGYQTAGFERDLAGLEQMQHQAELHTDSFGGRPKMYISPAGEFFETELDPTYGNKMFRTYDWLTLGHEIGIQGHAIEFSGTPYCWPRRAATQAGAEKKLLDLHDVAERWFNKGRKVNLGLTLVPGAKLETGTFGNDLAATEKFLDRVAYRLGYRIAFEDWDNCVEDSPGAGQAAPQYLHRADYGDGVAMYKVCHQGAPSTDCKTSPRCETGDQAIARLEQALAAMKADPDASHLYYFAFASHAGSFVPGFDSDRGEAGATLAILRHIDQLVAAGEKIAFVTPREVAAKAILAQTSRGPLYFMALHVEPAIFGKTQEQVFAALHPGTQALVSYADQYGMKLTLMFGAPWGTYLRSDAARSAELDAWTQQGHEVAAHHHAVCHGGWDGYSSRSKAEAEAMRAQCGAPKAYVGSLEDMMKELRKLNPYIRSGCMNEESNWLELGGILYATCSGYGNSGEPGTLLSDGTPEKARNDFVSTSLVDGAERKWLAHGQTFKPDKALAGLQVYASTATTSAVGFVVHPSSTTQEVASLKQIMDELHARDPNGERSMTVADLIRLGVLAEKQVQESSDGGTLPTDGGLPPPDGGLPMCGDAGTCNAGFVCCPSPLACAGQCVSDCRAGNPCPPQIPRCAAATGLCGP